MLGRSSVKPQFHPPLRRGGGKSGLWCSVFGVITAEWITEREGGPPKNWKRVSIGGEDEAVLRGRERIYCRTRERGASEGEGEWTKGFTMS